MAERGRHLLRVLAAVAWSDGELAPEEEAFLRSLGRDLALSAEGSIELERLLSLPVPRDEFDRYAREFEQEVDSPEERRELLRAVETLIGADRVRSPEEIDCLTHLRDWLAEDDAPRVAREGAWQTLRGSLRGTFIVAAVPLAWAGKLTQSLTQLGGGAQSERIDPTRREFVALFGALVQRVVEADGRIHPSEMESLRSALSTRFGLSEAEVEYVLALIARRAAEGADRQRLCSEFNRVSDAEERMDLVRALFAAARADGEITSAEEMEARLISNYLWVETQEYVRLRREAAGLA